MISHDFGATRFRSARLSTRCWFRTFVEFAPGNLWKNKSSILMGRKKSAPSTPFEYRIQLYVYIHRQTNHIYILFFIHIIPIFTSFFTPQNQNPINKKHLFTHLLQCVPVEIKPGQIIYSDQTAE